MPTTIKTGTRPTKRQLEELDRLLEEPTGKDLLEDEAVFRARGRGFRVVRVPERWWVEEGMRQTSPAITFDFSPNGEFRTNDKRAVDYLQSLDSYRREFWLLGDEVDAVPSSEPVIAKIMALAIELDDDGIAELERQEQESYERADVLIACAQARRQVQGLLSAQKAVNAA